MRQPAAAFILIISFLMAGPAIAGQLEDADKAYDRGDYVTAYRLFKPLAAQGNAHAQDALGLMYENGQGVPQDYAEAEKWYREAADQGNASAQYKLGSMYTLGQGVPQDYVMAYMWFNLASSSLPSSDGERRNKAESNRDNVASKMTPAQIAEAQKLAREWKPKKER